MAKTKIEKLFTEMGLMDKHDLRLAPGLSIEVRRLGYADEGLRLTVSMGFPYNYNAEVKLGRADAEWLATKLRQELDNPRNANMPK